jgi:HKD family nuclease
MIVFKRFVILQGPQNSLEKTIHFLLNCGEYSWDKIYLFSAFVKDDGVEQVKKILEHRSLNENTEVVIAIGQKDNFNKPSDIQKILSLSNSKKVDFICPETIDDDNFHIKAYCFLGSSMKGKGSKIGFSIIGSSNLTQTGLEGKGELCISIQNLNLTNKLIEHLKNKYSNSPRWSPEIIREYQIEYDKKYPGKDQLSITITPLDGKFIKVGVLTDSVLLAKATTLINGRDMGCFHSIQTIDEEKNDVRKNSLCLLFSTENEIFRIVEIWDHSSDEENTEGCFVRFRENVTYELSDDIRDILANEKYKIISNPEDMEKLPYDTLKDFENEVKEYQKMLNDPNYKKGIEKGKKKMQSEIDRLSEEITYLKSLLKV